MTIYTPKAMPIKFPVDYAFTLLARLYPKVKPYKVLKTAEGIDNTHVSVSLLAALICFLFKLEPLYIVIIVLIMGTLIKAMHIRSKYLFPLVNVGVIYSYSSFGIINIFVLTVGWFMTSWKGIIALIIARLITGVINSIQETKERYRVKFKYTEFERAFIDSYRYYATQLGVTTDISLTEEEEKSNLWRLVYTDYSQECPLIVETYKFT